MNAAASGALLEPSEATVAPGVVETARTFDVAGTPALAILSRPERPGPRATTLVAIVVGGPQYRVGSHRQFVSLARALAAAGFCALRFDVRGMGDAAGATRAFTELDDDLAAALDAGAAMAAPHVPDGLPLRVVLWGLCDGASAALMHLPWRPAAGSGRPRIAGVALLNPWLRSEATQARARLGHYYRDRLRDPAFWAKLARGGVGLKALRGWLQARRAARAAPATSVDADLASPGSATPPPPYPQRMLAGWSSFDGPILLMLSGRDLTAREFEAWCETSDEWRRAQASPRVDRHPLAQADHTLSDPDEQRRAEATTVAWLEARVLAAPATPTSPSTRLGGHRP